QGQQQAGLAAVHGGLWRRASTAAVLRRLQAVERARHRPPGKPAGDGGTGGHAVERAHPAGGGGGHRVAQRQSMWAVVNWPPGHLTHAAARLLLRVWNYLSETDNWRRSTTGCVKLPPVRAGS